MSNVGMQTRRSTAPKSEPPVGSQSKLASAKAPVVKKQGPRDLLTDSSCAALLLPAVLVILAHGGRFVLGVVAIGLMLTYLLESTKHTESSFATFWVTLATLVVGMIASSLRLLRHSIFSIFLIYNMLALLFLVGVWGSFHLEYFRTQRATLKRTAERFLLGTLMVPSSVVTTWGIVALGGVDYAAFYLQLTLFAHHYLLSLPQKASFDEHHHTLAIGPFEGAVHTISLFLHPMIVYICLYYRVLHQPDHLVNLVVLYILPFVYLWLCRHHKPLEFTGIAPHVQSMCINVMGSIALALLVGCFEYRVVFGSFAHYIVFPPPFSYMVVTAALYSGLGLLLLHVHGTVAMDQLFTDITLYLSVFAALAWSLVVGLPLVVVPFPVMMTYFAFLFYSHRKLSQFVVVAISGAVVAAWLLWHSFWFLDFRFAVRSIHLQTMCTILWLLVALALLALGLVIATGRTSLDDPLSGLTEAMDQTNSTGNSVLQIVLVLQAALLAVAEKILFEQPEALYPPAMLMLTSALGAAATLRLVKVEVIDITTGWLLLSFAIGKLAALLDSPQWDVEQHSQTQSLWISLHGVMAVLVVLPVWAGPSPVPGQTMPAGLGGMHAVSILVVCFMCKHSLFERVAQLAGEYQPSSALLHGSFVLVSAIALLPLSCIQLVTAFPEMRVVNLFMIGVGVILIVLQPPMHSSALHAMLHGGQVATAPQHVTDRLVEMPDALWAPWMLTSALIVVVALLTGLFPVPKSKVGKLGLSTAIGFPLGGALACYFLPMSTLMMLELGFISSLAISLLGVAVGPTADLQQDPSWIVALFMAMLPVAWSSLSLVMSSPRKTSGAVNYLSIGRMLLLSCYAVFGFAFALLLKVRGSVQPAKRTTSSKMQQDQPVEWMIRAGNMSTLLCFCTALTVESLYFRGSEVSVLLLAPVFLLLETRTTFLEGSHRYLVPVLVSSGLGFAVVLSKLHLGFLLRYFHLSSDIYASSSWMQIAKHTMLVAFTLPSHYYAATYLSKPQAQSIMQIWLLTPLNILCVLLSNMFTLQLLGGMGMIYAGLLAYTLNTMQKVGKRII